MSQRQLVTLLIVVGVILAALSASLAGLVWIKAVQQTGAERRDAEAIKHLESQLARLNEYYHLFNDALDLYTLAEEKRHVQSGLQTATKALTEHRALVEQVIQERGIEGQREAINLRQVSARMAKRLEEAIEDKKLSQKFQDFNNQELFDDQDKRLEAAQKNLKATEKRYDEFFSP